MGSERERETSQLGRAWHASLSSNITDLGRGGCIDHRWLCEQNIHYMMFLDPIRDRLLKLPRRTGHHASLCPSPRLRFPLCPVSSPSPAIPALTPHSPDDAKQDHDDDFPYLSPSPPIMYILFSSNFPPHAYQVS